MHYFGKDISGMGYRQLLSDLIGGGYALTDAYERNLKKIHGVKADIVIANDTILQSIWATENSVSAEGSAIVFEQVKSYKPSVIMIEDLYWATSDFIKALRQLPFVKVVFGHHCSPSNDTILKNMKMLDFVVSCSPLLMEEYKRNGISNSFLIYHAFDHSILSKLPSSNGKKSKKVIFTGSFLPGVELHNYRKTLVEYLVDKKTNIDIYSERVLYSRRERVAWPIFVLLKHISGVKSAKSILRKIGLDSDFDQQAFWKKIAPFLRKPVYGLEMYDQVQQSSICLNIHGGIAGKYAANMRLFEATGVGTCLLTDEKLNMNDLFIPDVECVTYQNKEDAKAKITWLLNNPVKMAEIAKAGQERCLRDHSYQARVVQLNDIITRFL
jgi:spore maturation protein CgeB